MRNEYPFGKEYGEVVSPGHPDKLADTIADKIVAVTFRHDSSALVGVEVATALNRVFITGRIGAANRLRMMLDLNVITKEVYSAAGYGKNNSGMNWAPDLDDIIVDESGLIRDEISEDEREIRSLSDDQSITVGYAVNSPETNFIPRAQWLAWHVMHEIRSLTTKKPDEFGPDAKVLTQVSNDGLRWIFDRLIVSMQHVPSIDWSEPVRIVYKALYNLKERFRKTGVQCNIDLDAIDLIINGHGDFSTGGPMGDNGLSGKKLVMDAYGPMVPIGGGAYSGKDPHKVDRVGAVLARDMALYSVINEGNPWDIIQLTWAPGKPNYVSLNSGMGVKCNFEHFPETIRQCVDKYFQKSAHNLIPEFALKGWYSGFCKAPWEGLLKQNLYPSTPPLI